MEYDFSGWATKNDIKCADNLIIKKGAFGVKDGTKVPLVWNHQHKSVQSVLGHALLYNKNEGVYALCSFNDTAAAKDAKAALKHGDIESLSIWANDIETDGPNVTHGTIREVSLVLAGANPGARIESVINHGQLMGDFEDEGIIYTGEGVMLNTGSEIEHSQSEDKADIKHSDEEKSKSDKNSEEKESGKTLEDVYKTLNDEQKTMMAIVVGQAVADSKDSNKEKKEDKTVAHDIFDQDKNDKTTRVLSHSEGMAIIQAAKDGVGSLKAAYRAAVGDDVICHAVPTEGMTVPGTKPTTDAAKYGIQGIESLYPDYRNLNTPPEFISRNMDWVTKVLTGVHRLPYEKIRSVFADITQDDARAKGYIKGTQKWTEIFSLLNRKTDAQTVYKLQKLDRDDILSITEFEVVPWLKGEMQIMLNEEIARAILIGDGRLSTDQFKIQETNIRPIVSDVPLFNVRVKVSPSTGATMNDVAKKTINTIIKNRKKYKGTGNPTFFITEDALSEMLLLEDKIGNKLYKTMAELQTALRVSDIQTVEAMTGYKIDGEELIGVIVNLNDYAVGQNPKSKRDMMEDFDINFNKYEYLIEERLSGALRKPFSAMTITLASGFTFSDEVESGGSDGDTEGGKS